MNTSHDVDRQVEAVLDILAPYPDIPAAAAGSLAYLAGLQHVRVPAILIDYDGQPMRPTDATLRALAEQIVTAIRTAGGPS